MIQVYHLRLYVAIAAEIGPTDDCLTLDEMSNSIVETLCDVFTDDNTGVVCNVLDGRVDVIEKGHSER